MDCIVQARERQRDSSTFRPRLAILQHLRSEDRPPSLLIILIGVSLEPERPWTGRNKLCISKLFPPHTLSDQYRERGSCAPYYSPREIVPSEMEPSRHRRLHQFAALGRFVRGSKMRMNDTPCERRLNYGFIECLVRPPHPPPLYHAILRRKRTLNIQSTVARPASSVRPLPRRHNRLRTCERPDHFDFELWINLGSAWVPPSPKHFFFPLPSVMHFSLPLVVRYGRD